MHLLSYQTQKKTNKQNKKIKTIHDQIQKVWIHHFKSHGNAGGSPKADATFQRGLEIE